MTELNEFIIEQLKDTEFQKEYMNESLAQYINDGDFNAFFHSLELVIKSRDSISGFCAKAGIDRAMLYQILYEVNILCLCKKYRKLSYLRFHSSHP